MDIIATIELVFSPFAGPLNTLDRMKAARSRFVPGGQSSPWVVVAILLALIVVAGIVAALWRRRVRHKKQWGKFSNHANRVGLSNEEQSLAIKIAGAAGAQDPNTVFVSDTVFNRGAEKLINRSVRDSGSSGTCGTCAFLLSLRQKLSFQIPSGKAKVASVDLGPIDPGMVLNVLRQRVPEEFEVVVIQPEDSSEGLTVRIEERVDCRPGESWVVRYPRDGILWEFNAWATKVAGQAVSLRPVGKLRWVNRRKFVRVPADNPAHVAPFPFEQADRQKGGPPEFVPARLVEIAGPGLMLETEVQARTGERVLVVLELDDTIVESLATVRRGRPEGATQGPIAVELVGLTTSDVSRLARETNVAAKANEVDPRLGEPVEMAGQEG